MFLPFFPDLADDSYATIGLDGPAATSGIAGAADPYWLRMCFVANHFRLLHQLEAQCLNVNTLTGGSWYVLNTAGQCIA